MQWADSVRDLTAARTGAEGTRTPDLLHAMQAFSQLNYGPGSVRVVAAGGAGGVVGPDDREVVRLIGPNEAEGFYGGCGRRATGVGVQPGSFSCSSIVAFQQVGGRCRSGNWIPAFAGMTFGRAIGVGVQPGSFSCSSIVAFQGRLRPEARWSTRSFRGGSEGRLGPDGALGVFGEPAEGDWGHVAYSWWLAGAWAT